MEWVEENYGKKYAPNTRETFRRQTMHQFVQAGIALYNPDQPDRPVNSPHAKYGIEPFCLRVLQSCGTKSYEARLAVFLKSHATLVSQYAKSRQLTQIPVQIENGREVRLSPGQHSELIRAIWEEFAPRYVPGGQLVYVGDTGTKWGYFAEELLVPLNVRVDNHGKMPDVLIYDPRRNWLVLAEAVTSHGPVDAKRHMELRAMFKRCGAGLVFVSAFPNRKTFAKYLSAISWETEVWIAENPDHLIHFNGSRFLGPYSQR